MKQTAADVHSLQRSTSQVPHLSAAAAQEGHGVAMSIPYTDPKNWNLSSVKIEVLEHRYKILFLGSMGGYSLRAKEKNSPPGPGARSAQVWNIG